MYNLEGKYQNVVVFDLETTINAPTPFWGADPFYPSNEIVLAGASIFVPEEEGSTQIFTSDIEELLLYMTDNSLVVGHNLSFDLAYLMRYRKELNFDIWDTQQFEFLRTGCDYRRPSLEKTSEHWSVPFKKDADVKVCFDIGMGSDQIDIDLLRAYLKEDVRSTEEVFRKQLEHFSEETTKYYLEVMQSIKTTTCMSFNGLPFDAENAQKVLEEREKEHAERERNLSEKWGTPFQPETQFNLSSPKQVTALLWGDDHYAVKKSLPITERDSEGNEVNVYYKSGEKKGEQKFKTAEIYKEIKPMISNEIKQVFLENKWEIGKSDADTFNRILKLAKKDILLKQFSKDVIELRSDSKNLKTYLSPYIKYSVNGRVHGKFSHCGTATGRTSSSDPNIQNIQKGEFLKFFRAESGNKLIELDYAQLEIRVLALASGDKNLAKDINDGVDLHRYFASQIFDKPQEEITKQERTTAKEFSFQLQYGGTADGMVRRWAVAPELAQKFVDSYYKKYPQVKEWQNNNIKIAKKSRKWKGHYSKTKGAMECFFLPTIWKNLDGEPLSWFMSPYSFSSFEQNVKNYPIQGGACDMMKFMLPDLHESLLNFNATQQHKAKIINFVHDAVWIEAPEEACQEVISIAKETMEKVPEKLLSLFRIFSPIPFPVDSGVGKTLFDVKQNA